MLLLQGWTASSSSSVVQQRPAGTESLSGSPSFAGNLQSSCSVWLPWLPGHHRPLRTSPPPRERAWSPGPGPRRELPATSADTGRFVGVRSCRAAPRSVRELLAAALPSSSSSSSPELRRRAASRRRPVSSCLCSSWEPPRLRPPSPFGPPRRSGRGRRRPLQQEQRRLRPPAPRAETQAVVCGVWPVWRLICLVLGPEDEEEQRRWVGLRGSITLVPLSFSSSP